MWDNLSDRETAEEAEFPTTGTPAQKLQYLLRYAILAPSLYNMQPWYFRIHRDQVGLYIDRDRDLPVVDPKCRERIISCGAALFHLHIALRHFGYGGSVQTFPEPDDPNLLANISLGRAVRGEEEDHRLFHSIARRHTSRMEFFRHPIQAHVLEALQTSQKFSHIWIEVVLKGASRDALVELITQADREQLANPEFRRELAAWVRLRGERRSDGIPITALHMPGLVTYSEPFSLRTFDAGALHAARVRQLAIGTPTLLVLGSHADRPQDWLDTGQALARLLLQATAEGIRASFMNAPVEIAALRPRVADLLGSPGFPQMILRMGYGSAVEPTPRWAVEKVSTVDDQHGDAQADEIADADERPISPDGQDLSPSA